MNDKNKMLLCLLGVFLSSQLGWFIKDAGFFNGISLLFGIGFGWYARSSRLFQKTGESK